MWAAALLGKSILSHSVCIFFSLSVAFSAKPNDVVRPAQCGILRVTGTKNSRPCGPHITRGESIVSPASGEERKYKKHGGLVNLICKILHAEDVYSLCCK